MSFTDKAVVRCAANKIEVALDKRFIPDQDFSELTLLDGMCSLSSNATHIMATLSFHTCGTVLEVSRSVSKRRGFGENRWLLLCTVWSFDFCLRN